MNARTPIGVHATSERAVAYRPEHLDEPRAQPCCEGMDDTADYAEQQRNDKRSGNLIDILHALPTERLLTEARALQARMLGSQYSVHDFALVVAMTRRIERQMPGAQAVNREPLDGALWLDLGRVV